MLQDRTALLSAHRKTPALAEFAGQLKKNGFDIVATHNTADYLHQSGIVVHFLDELVGPPILGHKVVTLSRKLFASILASSDEDDELAKLLLTPIHLVYVDPYPLADAMADPNRTYESVVRHIDIGGIALLRAAAKGERIVLCGEHQFPEVISFLEGGPGYLQPRRFLGRLAAEAVETAIGHSSLEREFYVHVADGTIV
jgi:phosphoribosylaminoimidazolecarboxamide formyltransferase/IMP cyclohydrolase